MKILFKKLTDNHLKDALQIYNFYITNSLSNFEEKRLSLKYFKLLHKKIINNRLPFIVCLENERVVGLAFVNKFREKSGYRYTHEHSIYVDQNKINNGYGSIILKELIKICKKNKNIKNLIAVIGGSDNKASIKIHKNNGFEYIGTLKKVGFKKNKWIDSIYMQRKL
tara:strand:- start:91 stop:591 length:501 start_codon:yes stop_codon:yes gene_type:complete